MIALTIASSMCNSVQEPIMASDGCIANASFVQMEQRNKPKQDDQVEFKLDSASFNPIPVVQPPLVAQAHDEIKQGSKMSLAQVTAQALKDLIAEQIAQPPQMAQPYMHPDVSYVPMPPAHHQPNYMHHTQPAKPTHHQPDQQPAKRITLRVIDPTLQQPNYMPHNQPVDNKENNMRSNQLKQQTDDERDPEQQDDQVEFKLDSASFNPIPAFQPPLVAQAHDEIKQGSKMSLAQVTAQALKDLIAEQIAQPPQMAQPYMHPDVSLDSASFNPIPVFQPPLVAQAGSNIHTTTPTRPRPKKRVPGSRKHICQNYNRHKGCTDTARSRAHVCNLPHSSADGCNSSNQLKQQTDDENHPEQSPLGSIWQDNSMFYTELRSEEKNSEAESLSQELNSKFITELISDA